LLVRQRRLGMRQSLRRWIRHRSFLARLH
jgi:hypothetical protein